jgi:glycerate kinase
LQRDVLLGGHRLAGWRTVSRRAPWLERPLLIAPDAFKGTLSATTVAAAIGRGVAAAGLGPGDLCPVADGGEGTADVLVGARGGETRTVTVADPLGRPIRAGFVMLADGVTAVVEVAAASGLDRVAPAERDAEAASSAGTGELIAAAAQAGAHTILLAAGGSATTDGGRGAIEALERSGGLGAAKLVVLCDVRTPFELAADRFGPQKGADPAAVGRLRKRLARIAQRLPRDPRGLPMTGAAGGLAGGLWAACGAQLVPGAAFVLEALDFDRRLRAARAVVVGEGRLDRTTLEGKIAAEIATRARQAGVPAHAIVGVDAIDRFDARILDLQLILEAGTVAQLEQAGRRLAEALQSDRPCDDRPRDATDR